MIRDFLDAMEALYGPDYASVRIRVAAGIPRERVRLERVASYWRFD